MSNENAEPLDLWSLLPGEGEGPASPAVTGRPGAEGLRPGRDPPLDKSGAPAQPTLTGTLPPSRERAQVWAGDWQGALRALQEALVRGAASSCEIRPEEVADAMRQELPEITWRVLALLDQIPARGAIRLTPLRPIVERDGACDLCGDELADPQHFPPRCERCGRAARLALGYLSLADLLCSGG